jgi:SAM-dependent methyltransferase
VERHLPSSPETLHVLDAGAGSGGYAFPLAEAGHRVCLLDFSGEMLALARQQAAGLDPQARERLSFCQASVVEIPERFPPSHFDLVLCHTLLEYVREPWAAVQTLVAALRPGGMLSLLFANPHADPLRWAAKGEVAKAHLALSQETGSADLFGLPRRTYTVEAMEEALVEAGARVAARYGIRIFADYVPADKLADPAVWAQVQQLEAAAAVLDPYRQIARYNQLLAIKALG